MKLFGLWDAQAAPRSKLTRKKNGAELFQGKKTFRSWSSIRGAPNQDEV